MRKRIGERRLKGVNLRENGFERIGGNELAGSREKAVPEPHRACDVIQFPVGDELELATVQIKATILDDDHEGLQK